MAVKRNTIISIAKGIAIILMVIAHAEAPGWLCKFIFEFHMPLFFITAGFFFSTKYLHDEATFVKKRVKGLYIPFVKWAVFFLFIHNWMFDIGILNEVYGNEQGGVLHPWSTHQIQQNLWNIFTAMGGYDAFLCGAFWFFRGLFVASILYLIIYKVVDLGISRYPRLTRMTQFVDDYRQIISRPYLAIPATLLFGLIVWLFSKYLTANMNWRSTFQQFLSLPVPAILGFLMTYNISQWIDAGKGWFKQFLIYTGDHTLNIFIFHIISYKVVSLIKIWYYGLDIRQIGCHMVIHEHSQEDCFWILYTVAGVGIPLLGTWLCEKAKERIRAYRASSAAQPQ